MHETRTATCRTEALDLLRYMLPRFLAVCVVGYLLARLLYP